MAASSSVVSKKKVAVLGSAFNPPTKGHQDVVNQCLAAGFDEVWLVPAYAHAFGKKMADYDHRVKLVEAFCKDINDPRVMVCAVEKAISETKEEAAPVYSIDLMKHLQTTHPDYTLSLILGPDNAEKFDEFFDSAALREHFAPFVAEERLSIRSTIIRAALAEEAAETIKEMVTPGVFYLLTEKPEEKATPSPRP